MLLDWMALIFAVCDILEGWRKLSGVQKKNHVFDNGVPAGPDDQVRAFNFDLVRPEDFS